MGLAMGEAVELALKAKGYQIVGIRWRWLPGMKGGIYDPHLARDNVAVFNPEGFVGDDPDTHGAIPGDGRSVNDAYCACHHRWLLRGPDGRFLPETAA